MLKGDLLAPGGGRAREDSGLRRGRPRRSGLGPQMTGEGGSDPGVALVPYAPDATRDSEPLCAWRDNAISSRTRSSTSVQFLARSSPSPRSATSQRRFPSVRVRAVP